MNSITHRHWTLVSIIVLLLGAAWIGISAVFFKGSTNGYIPAPKEGFLAPDFSLTTSTGEEISLSGLHGQAILVNFWASWCSPCRAEMPAMQRVYDDYQENGFVFLAVNANRQDSVAAANAFVVEHGLTFPVLFDSDGTVSERYLVHSFPTSFFIDKQGIIQEVVIGGPMAEALLRTRVESLLEESN